MRRIEVVIGCSLLGVSLAFAMAHASEDAYDCAGVDALIESADLVLYAEVTDADIGGRFGVDRLSMLGVWHEHPSVRDAWDRKNLTIMTREELIAGQGVIAFVQYDPESTRFFASVGVFSDGRTVDRGHPALIGREVHDLHGLVQTHEQPDALPALIAWAELIGVGEVEKLHLSGLYGLHQIRMCEVWHGHAGMDEYWDGRTLTLPIREDGHMLRREPIVGERFVMFVRYDHEACSFDSEIGMLSPSDFVILGSEALVGACLADLRDAVAAHNQPQHPFSPLGTRERARDAK